MLNRLFWILTLSNSLLLSSIAASSESDKDQEKQLTDVEKKCQEGQLGACLQLGLFYKEQGRDDLAIKFFTPACEGDDAGACLLLAGYAEKNKDQKTAMHWLRRSCRSPKSDGRGCFEIARYAEAMKSPENAKIWYKKSCELGYKKGCDKIKSK